MKKLIILFFVATIAFPVFAGIDAKQIVGKWKYVVNTGDSEMTGVLKITETDGKLGGEAITAEGYVLPFTKIEIKEGNLLSIEMKTDADHYKIEIKFDGSKFSGRGSSYQGEAPITGEKIPE